MNRRIGPRLIGLGFDLDGELLRASTDLLRVAAGLEAAPAIDLLPLVPSPRLAAGPAAVVLWLGGFAESGEGLAEVEATARAATTRVLEDPERTLAVCTVFRHVGPRADRPEILRRIRRLNLLAVDLSADLGVTVIDLDRDLAAVGACALATDHRVSGAGGRAAAARSIAGGLADGLLDPWLSPAAQARALDHLRALAPSPGTGVNEGRRRAAPIRGLLITRGQGAGALAREVLAGRIGMAEAFRRLRAAVVRRGLGPTLARLARARPQILQARRGRLAR